MFHGLTCIVERDKMYYNKYVIKVIYEINYMENNYAGRCKTT